MTNRYELLSLIPGNLTEEEAKTAIETVKSAATKHDAKVLSEDFWGKRKLAYAIDHLRQGYYYLVEIDLDPAKVSPLESDLRLNDKVVRFQLTTKTVKSPETLAREEALRQRIAAKRQAERERQHAAAMADQRPAEPAAPVPTGPVEPKQLDEKLEEILGSDKVDL